jgi:hypothetical protein
MNGESNYWGSVNAAVRDSIGMPARILQVSHEPHAEAGLRSTHIPVSGGRIVREENNWKAGLPY